MALIKLNDEQLESGLGVLMDKTNGAVLEAVTPLAAAIKNSNDENKQMQDLLEGAKKFQSGFNTFTDGVEKFVEETKGLIEVKDFLEKRKTIGEVANRETGFNVNKLNTQAMVQ